MKREELMKAVLRISVQTGSLVCLGCGHENNCGIHGCAILRGAADCIQELTAKLDDMQKRYDEINDFDQSQSAKLLMQLAERDKQLGLAVEALESVAHSGGNFCEFCSSDCCDAGLDDPDTFQCGCFKWCGAQKETDHG